MFIAFLAILKIEKQFIMTKGSEVMRFLLIGLLVFILLEIGILIWVGSKIGVLSVLLIIIITGILGFYLGRRQGFQTWNRALQEMGRNQAPASAFIDSICIIFGSVLLIAPGFISDFFGLLLLIPFTRNLLKLYIAKMLDKLVKRGMVIYRRY